MRGYNPYGVRLLALALFFAPLLNEGVVAGTSAIAAFNQFRLIQLRDFKPFRTVWHYFARISAQSPLLLQRQAYFPVPLFHRFK